MPPGAEVQPVVRVLRHQGAVAAVTDLLQPPEPIELVGVVPAVIGLASRGIVGLAVHRAHARGRLTRQLLIGLVEGAGLIQFVGAAEGAVPVQIQPVVQPRSRGRESGTSPRLLPPLPSSF